MLREHDEIYGIPSVHSARKEHQAVNSVISVWPIKAPSVDMYAEGSVPGLFNRMEIKHLLLPLHQILSAVSTGSRFGTVERQLQSLLGTGTRQKGELQHPTTHTQTPEEPWDRPKQSVFSLLICEHRYCLIIFKWVLRRRLGSPAVCGWRSCPLGLVLNWLSPPGLNSLWAYGHAVAHHPADRQILEWGHPLDWQTSLIATVFPPLLWFNSLSQVPLA